MIFMIFLFDNMSIYFFSYLASWTFATIKNIYVILLATWHCYWSKWTAVPFMKENFNLMLLNFLVPNMKDQFILVPNT